MSTNPFTDPDIITQSTNGLHPLWIIIIVVVVVTTSSIIIYLLWKKWQGKGLAKQTPSPKEETVNQQTQYTKCAFCGYETPVQFKKCTHCGAVL